MKKLIMVFGTLCLVLFASSTTRATDVTMDDPPGLDYVIVDPFIVSENGFPEPIPADWFAGEPTVKTGMNFDTWIEVTDYLDTLTGKGVALWAHGDSGEFCWGGKTDADVVLDDSTEATTNWLNSMVGNINYLGFISCSVAEGTKGTNFLTEVAGYLGKSYGYTDEIKVSWSVMWHQWYIEQGGSLVVIPEPATLSLLLLGLGGLMLVCRRRM